jgi:predicted membrane protein
MGTWAFAINDPGVILGAYTDDNLTVNSYLRAPDGRFTTIDDPIAATGPGQGTWAYNLNQDGTVTGDWVDSGDLAHGFLRAPDGRFTTIDAPGAGTTGAFAGGQGTYIEGRNDAGTIAGLVVDGNWVFHGFVRTRHGSITTFDAPGGGTAPGQGIRMWASAGVINPAGVIVGTVWEAGYVGRGFLRAPDGAITEFDAPGAGTGAYLGTYAWSINPVGEVTGYYCDALMCHGFLRAPDGSFTTFDVPGAADTVPLCINTSGVITGYYYDSSFVEHGFVRDKHGAITVFDVPGAVDTTPSTINSSGEITGYYLGTDNLVHGFLRIP